MCSVCLVKHILVWSVIVVDFFGEKRRQVQELCAGLDWGLLEVVGAGLITCGEEELVRRVHTLFVRSAQKVQVDYELQVQEEREGVWQVVQEIERKSTGEEKRLHEYGHVDGVKDSTLEPRCVCVMMWHCATRRDYARSRSDIVEVCGSGSCCHWCNASCSVTTQSRSIHCSEFSTSCPSSHFVVRLYQFIITFPVSHFVHTIAPRKHSHLRCGKFTPSVGYSRPPSAVTDPSVTK